MIGLTSNNQSQNTFTLINFSADLLGSYFNARTTGRVVSAIQNASYGAERGPAVVTPWDLADKNSDRVLAAKFNAIRDKKDFIDLNAKSIKNNRNKDEKALFALYTALNNLKVVADYAADGSTPTALLTKLSSQFRGGLSQVQDYIHKAELDKLTLLYGKKEPRAQSDISLGKSNYDILGSTLSVSSKTQTIPGITGSEVFTINLDKTTANDNITIDLSQIAAPINLTNLTSYINQQIIALTVPDSNGDPVVKYKSRFEVSEVSAGKFALKFNVNSGEKVTLTAQTSEPSLYITGAHKAAGIGQTETATLTKIRDLSSTAPITEFSHQIAGTDQNSLLPPLTDANGKVIESPPEVFETKANATAVDSQGNVYVVGSTKGDFGNQINTSGTQDVFLTKNDASGNVLWSRLLGASDKAEAFDVVVDGNDNVIIAGQVNDELISSDTLKGFDSFVTKYDKGGKELWTNQQDTVAEDKANNLAIDANGDVFVTGSILGRLNANTTYGGASDIFVTKLGGSDGKLVASAQIGGVGTELGKAITIANDGNILIASQDSGRAIIHKLDATDLTVELASYDLGDLGGGSISDIKVDATGSIYVAGTSLSSSLSGGTVTSAHSGGADGFITKLTDSGTSITADWTHYLGSSETDSIEGLTIQNGAVYVAGKTSGTLPGATKGGTTDGFAAKIDATTGSTDWIRQFGTASGYNGGSSLSFSAAGSSILTKLGLPTGLYNNSQTRNIETQTSARADDFFFISVDGGRSLKVTIKAGDDYNTLAKRIQRLSFRSIKAVQIIGTDGPELKIEPQNGSTLEIIAGTGAKDALAKLGLKPGKILPASKLFVIGDDTIGTDPNNLGGIFALDLQSGFSLRSKKEAEFVSAQISKTLETIKRAYRSLTFDPVKADILKQSKIKKGVVPPYLLSKLSNYQDGLNRLSIVSQGLGLSV